MGSRSSLTGRVAAAATRGLAVRHATPQETVLARSLLEPLLGHLGQVAPSSSSNSSVSAGVRLRFPWAAILPPAVSGPGCHSHGKPGTLVAELNGEPGTGQTARWIRTS